MHIKLRCLFLILIGILVAGYQAAAPLTIVMASEPECGHTIGSIPTPMPQSAPSRSQIYEFKARLLSAERLVDSQQTPSEMTESGDVPTTPVIESAPEVINPLFIESLRQYRNSSPSDIEIVRVKAETGAFIQYEIAYLSEGSRVTGIMNVPQNDSPEVAGSGPSGWPVIILNHGHYSPQDYTSGTGTQLEADYLAAHGYVTIFSDYRGYGGSEGRPGNHFDPAWTHDVINLVDALPSLNFVDPDRVGMWGHSTGGEIALQILTSRTSVDAAVLFGSMGADTADNLPHVVQEWGDVGERTIEQFGLPEDAPDIWAKFSPITYLADASGPISIHHGDLDNEVPPELSARLWQAMPQANVAGEYFMYPSQGHFFGGSAWAQAMRRSLEFFDRYVKRTDFVPSISGQDLRGRIPE